VKGSLLAYPHPRLWRISSTVFLIKVVEAVQVFCRGRNSKAMITERDYFVRNRQRMAYQTVRALKLPIGSGAIESAIRRVVNLRLKGACIFWGKDNAEKMPRKYSCSAPSTKLDAGTC
jgi:hypothetical protein